MEFHDFYYEDVILKEKFADFVNSVRGMFSKNQIPKKLHLWKSIEQEANRLFSKRDSELKTNWIMKKYKESGGDFQTVNEEIFKGGDFNTDYFQGYAEIYKNPNHAELNDIAKEAYDGGVRMGIDAKGDVYAWVEDILHDTVERFLKTDWKLKFEYTLGRDTLFLASGETGKHWKDYGLSKIDYFKQIMPKIIKIEMVSKPFTTVYKYE